MKYLFIDSNIWLSLYHFTNDDLFQFNKLKSFLKKDICLLIPTQTKNEVIRNRDKKLKDMLSSFKTFDLQFPTFSKSYREYDDFYKQFSNLKNKHKDWIKKIINDIENENLPADKAINDFFNIANEIECDEEIIMLAKQRYNIGNPPGKDGKYGDAINWECLLKHIPNGHDLFIISIDSDYASSLNKNSFNLFLKKEWKEKKDANVILYKSLSAFLKDHIIDISLKTEQEKDDLINALSESRNFTTTHAIIRQLNEYSDWTPSQKNDLLNILDTNSQVYWIIKDNDVCNFYSKLIENMSLENELVNNTKQLLSDE